MHPRIRLALLAASSLVLVGALIAVLTLRGGGGSDDGFHGAQSPPGIPPKDFTLKDENGKIFSLKQFRGQDVVVSFMYTTCRDTCPLLAGQIGVALSRLAHPIPAVAISVDPKNDTAQSAKTFLVNHEVLGNIRFLLGTRKELAPVWREYLIQPQTSKYEHTARVFLLDRHGSQADVFPVDQLTADDLTHDIEYMQKNGI